MAVIWSRIANYVNESVNYLSYQSPNYVSVTFMYIIECLFMPLVFPNIEIFLSSSGTIKWISGRIAG